MTTSAQSAPVAAAAPFRVAAATIVNPWHTADGLSHHLAGMREAAAQGASLVVFPELGMTGYPPRAEPMLGGEISARTLSDHDRDAVASLARELDIVVVYGATEQGECEAVYNTVFVVGPDGELGRYRKVHLTRLEQAVWTAGDQWPVIASPVGMLGPMICYDKSFPESARQLVLGGAEILVAPSAWNWTPGFRRDRSNPWRRQYVTFDDARAMENSRWLVSANLAPAAPVDAYLGGARIVTPLGALAAEIPFDRRAGTVAVRVVSAEVDLTASGLGAWVVNEGDYLARDRRPETYLR